MKGGWIGTLLLLGSGVIQLGCSGTALMSNRTSNSTTPVSLSVRDTPPGGVTILAFEITLTGAQLQPANNQPAVSLLNTPIEIEIKQLETETAFLNTAQAPAGTYNGIVVSFANPELTVFDSTGQFCSGQAVCQLKPTLNTATVTVTAPTAPFPLTLNANAPIGLVLDFDLNSSVQANLSVTPQVSFRATPALQPTGELEQIEDLLGQVTAIGSNQFTLREFFTGQSLTIAVNSTTQFEEFDKAGCSTNSFACLRVGQLVEVDLSVSASGTFLALKVSLEDEANQELAEGTVVSLDPTHNSFQMVVLGEVPDIAGLGLGVPVTVTVQPGAQFEIDNDGVPIPSGVSFAGFSDLLVGQQVKLRVLSVSSSGTGVAVTTDRVRLGFSQLTANVSTVAPPTFTVELLPTLLVTAGIARIQVVTSSATEFEDVSGVAGLAVGNRVSLRGLLFRTAGDPLLAASKVRKR